MDHSSTGRICAEQVVIELDLVQTFLRIARTAPDPQARLRNHTYAREAYRMADQYYSRLATPPEVKRTMEHAFAEARADLEAADEVFGKVSFGSEPKIVIPSSRSPSF